MNDQPYDHLTRRQLLRRAGAAGIVLSFPGLLAEAAAAGVDPKKLGKTLSISNWPLYIDIDEKTKKRPTIEQFQRKYGVKVKYVEDLNDNSSFFGKVQAQLRRGQSIGRDIIVMTDNSPYPALLIKNGWVEKLDKSVLPNLKNLQDVYKGASWDPKVEYHLPWQSGMTGIAYNLKQTKKPVTSVDQLLDDKKLHGKVTLLTEMADSVGLVMLANGDDPNKVTDATFDRALKRIEKAIKSGQVRKFTGNDYSQPLARGTYAASVSWSGDVVQLTLDNKNLKWVIPDDGAMLWTDHMLIPKKGDAYTASVFMDFVYEPKIAAQIAAYVNYVTPVKGVDKVLAKTDSETAKNPLIFPTAAMRKRLHSFDSNALFNADYKVKWQRLLGA
jgi:spermidine/putrescine transport system substrate-binding protein